MNLAGAIDELLCRLRPWLAILRYRPFLKCPVCHGSGGELVNTPDCINEFWECGECFPYWENVTDFGRPYDFWEGRVPLIRWLRLKLLVRTGHLHLRHLIACRIGRHAWMDETHLKPGLYICARCYEHKHEAQQADKPTATQPTERTSDERADE